MQTRRTYDITTGRMLTGRLPVSVYAAPASHTAPRRPKKIIQTLYPASRYSAGDLYEIRNNRIYMNENSKLMVSLVV